MRAAMGDGITVDGYLHWNLLTTTNGYLRNRVRTRSGRPRHLHPHATPVTGVARTTSPAVEPELGREHPVQRLALTLIAADPTRALELESADEPSPGPGRALIRMEAATINPTDFLYVAGQGFLTPALGETIGSEGVGRVIAVGPDTDTALLGRRVALLATYRHGTWSTHAVASLTTSLPSPTTGTPYSWPCWASTP